MHYDRFSPSKKCTYQVFRRLNSKHSWLIRKLSDIVWRQQQNWPSNQITVAWNDTILPSFELMTARQKYSDSRDSSWNVRIHVTIRKLPKRPGANRPDPVGAFCSERCEAIWQNIFWHHLECSETFPTRLGRRPSHIITWPCRASDAWLSLLRSDSRNGVSVSVNQSPDRRC